MPNPLLQSIQSAARANETLARMFQRAGTVESGQGYVISAYRTANRALKSALQEANRNLAIFDTIRTLKASLRTEITTSMQDASAFGLEEAGRQLGYYGVRPGASPIVLSSQVNSAVDAIMAQIDAQEQLINAYLAADMDTTLITGDESRQGVLRPSDILVGAAFWIAALTWDAFSYQATSTPQDFQKQAIAVIDGRTTDCCLKVHGQIQPLKGRFDLTGTPRFADQLEWSPFHWYCRTAITLYQGEFDDGYTERMQAGASYWLSERAAGRKPDQNPSPFVERL